MPLMQITTKSRYAITVLIELYFHQQQNNLVSIREIAERNKLSKSLIEQVIGKLRKSGIVKSIRGNKGGYVLTADAESLPIYKIITAIEENTDMTICKGGTNCSGGSICVTHHLWAGLSNTIYQYLNTITLTKVIEDIKKKGVRNQQLQNNTTENIITQII